MRLIDANALMAEMHNIILEDGEDRRTFYEVIERQPTIEPPRMRGKWTKDNACEFCGFQPWYERNINTLSFCPNCGAWMGGQDD